MCRPKKNPQVGPSFQSFLDEEGSADEVNDMAAKELLALQLDEAPKAKGIS